MIVALLALIAFLHPGFCLPLASAPAVTLCALTARLVAMGPAWLGWRRAGAFLNPVSRRSAKRSPSGRAWRGQSLPRSTV